MQLGPELGIIGAVVLAAQTFAAWLFAQRNKNLSERSRRLSRLEPAHLDMLKWGYQVRRVAAANGIDHLLPKLPESVERLYLDETDGNLQELESVIRIEQAVQRREQREDSG